MSHLARTAMTHRCTVQRDANYGDGTDPWGNDAAPAWGTHLSGLVCRFWFEDVSTIIDGQKSAEVTTRKMIVPPGTDITEDDRVVSVVDRLGEVLADGPMRVDSVGNRKGHIVVTMVDVR